MPASPVAALRTTVALARREKALGLLGFVLHSATLSFLSWREIALLVARVTAAWSGVIPFERTLNVAVWHAVCQAVVREHPFLCIPAKLPHGTICSWEAFFWEQLFPGSPATLTAASKAIARAMEGAGARDGCCARMATEAVAGRALLRRTVAHSERSWKLEEMDMFLCTSAFLANDLSRVQRYLLEGANPNKLCFGCVNDTSTPAFPTSRPLTPRLSPLSSTTGTLPSFAPPCWRMKHSYRCSWRWAQIPIAPAKPGSSVASPRRPCTRRRSAVTCPSPAGCSPQARSLTCRVATAPRR